MQTSTPMNKKLSKTELNPIQSQDVKNQLQAVAKKVLDASIYILALIVSFGIGYFYKDVNQPNKIETTFSKFNNPKQLHSLSISVTDRNELLIVDKQSQSIEIYQDSVGMSIFRAYANKLVTEVK